ncbi:MAG: SDR family oxidoreductase [Asticcacaulis sp.]
MSTLLVTGASGQLGRLVLEQLKGSEHTIIAATRDPSKLSDTGFETRALDFDRPETLATAFAGVDRVLLISTDAIDEAGKRLRQHSAAIAAAKAAGVKHIVYTSLPNPEPGSTLTLAPDHYGTEQAILNSGLDYTILRNNWYTQNLLGSLAQALASGQWFTSTAGGKVSYVTREDCAAVAASALLNPPAAKATFDLTGPAALSYAEIADIARKATGKPIELVELTDEQLKGGLTQAGLPDFVADMLVSFEKAVRNDELSAVSQTVQTLTGKAPVSAEAFLTTALKA